jgi:hypothetical protein
MASRLIEASSRIAVCGQPPVFLGVDVVGDGDQVVLVAHRLAEHLEQGGLAGADRAADAHAQGRQSLGAMGDVVQGGAHDGQFGSASKKA